MPTYQSPGVYVEEVAAVARGQYVRPAGGLPGPAEHYRLKDPAGALIAIASSDGGRLAPDKVFIAPTAATAADSNPATPAPVG